MTTRKLLPELNELIESYLVECELIKRLRPGTLKSYREMFHGFQKAIPEVTFVQELSPQKVHHFFKYISQKNVHGVKASTMRTYYDKLMPFFRWLESNNYLEMGTLVGRIIKPPRPKYEDIKALPVEQVHKLVSTISINGIHNSFQLKRDILIVHLLLFTGVRKGELLGIRLSDINFDHRNLKISAETSKSKRDRIIPINSILFSSIMSYLTELKIRKITTDRLIISQRSYRALTEDGLKRWVSRYNKLSGIKFHLHQFRHTFACALAKNNTDLTSIMRLLGHTSSTITERYLRSITPESARDSVEKLTY